jgi:hypothetical protein
MVSGDNTIPSGDSSGCPDSPGSPGSSSVALLEPFEEFFESLLWLPEATRRAEAAQNTTSAALWTPPVANSWSPATGTWTSTPAVGAAAKPKPPRTLRGLVKRARLVGLVVMVVAGGVRGAQSMSAKQIPPHPATFDPRVVPIVSYIESETGKPFKYPIAVQFVADSQFESLSILNDDANSSWKKSEKKEEGFLHCNDWGSGSGECGPIQPLTQPSTEAMFLRFLGVDIPRGNVPEPVLPRRQPHRYDSLTKRDIIGFYDPKTVTIYVRGTNFDAVRQTVAHELVHAWQDQNGVLDGVRMGVDSEYVHLAMVEGHAEMVSGRYLATLPASNKAAIELNDEEYGKEWTQKEKEANPQAGSASDTANKANTARMIELALGFWPYEAGPKFLGSRSKDQVNQLLKKPPLSTWDILNPSFDSAGRGKKLSKPSVRGERYTTQDFAIGPLFWSVGLTNALDDLSPRVFRNAWIGDSAVLYQATGTTKVCLLDRIEFIDVASTGNAMNILNHWANVHPLHSATVTAVGPTQIDVSVCA